MVHHPPKRLLYSPTLQCTNQLSEDLRTVPRIPIRQCCFVLVSNEVVGGSVLSETSHQRHHNPIHRASQSLSPQARHSRVCLS